MARCKMDKPERADYIRIFARHLLTDEDYEHLTRDEWGSVFLFILHQWTKGGSLPDDHAKLAGIARCTPKALADLLAKWPKLLPSGNRLWVFTKRKATVARLRLNHG